MQRVIELARVIRERHLKPIKTPLRELVVVHPDQSFLADLAGKKPPALRLRISPAYHASAPHVQGLLLVMQLARSHIRMLPRSLASSTLSLRCRFFLRSLLTHPAQAGTSSVLVCAAVQV